MKNFSLNKKIITLLSVFALGSFIIACVGISRVVIINDSLHNLFNKTSKRVHLAKDMDSLVNQLRNKEKTFILQTDQAKMEKEIQAIEHITVTISEKINAYKLVASKEGRVDLEKLEKFLTEWKEIDSELRQEKIAGNDNVATELSTGRSREKLEEFGHVLEGMVQRNEVSLNKEVNATDTIVASTKNIIIAVSVIAWLIGGILSYYVMKSMSKAIDQVVNNLNSSTQNVASAAAQIASSSEELSQSTTEQSSSLEETAASIEEMSSMISRNSESAKVVSENAMASQQNAIRGKETVDEMIKSIDEISESNHKIQDQINHSNEQLADIVKVISEIGNKTKVINDIVFQTKLLSFNASVEAARAGEHGKGFAVVAEEVGNLAQMSGNAAKEISDMLGDSIRKVETIVTETKFSVDRLINDGKVKVNNGIKVAKNCGTVLEEVVTSINTVTALAEEISTASFEQSQGINEITKAMNQLDQVTQQNAASTEQTASAAEELSAQAEALKGSVAVLETTIKGQKAVHKTEQKIEAKTEIKVVQVEVTKPQQNNVIKLQPEVKKEKVETKPAHAEVKKELVAEKAPDYNDARFKDV